MNYRTVDEINHFRFEDAYIADVQVKASHDVEEWDRFMNKEE